MTNSVTITFRAKRDNFAGGTGYKVPKLTNSHVTFAERDTRAATIMGTRDQSIFERQVAAFAGLNRIPGVIWEDGGNTTGIDPLDYRDDTSAWTITPRGNGFMADVTATFAYVPRNAQVTK